jgi:catecholate siderophore receptor
MLIRSVSLAALAGALAAPAAAQVDPHGAVTAKDSGTIIVIGHREDYAIEATSTATRTPTNLNDIPQAISIVTESQIDDQAMLSIGDVLRYVPGATIGQGEGHRDQVTIRGNNSTADFFVDGLRDDVQHYRGLYNVERVEVLKGPNAMIFGRGGGGGVINRVTKRPVANNFIRGSVGLDTEGAWLIDTDINRAFSDAAAVRLIAVYESFDNHRDFYEGHRYAINPTTAFSLGGRTRIDLSYEYDRDDRVVDRGIPSLSGRPLAGFDDVFFGDRQANQTDFEAHVLRGRVEHRFSDALSLTSRLLYGDYDKLYQNAFAATAVDPANGTVGIEAYRDATNRENLFSQTDLVWDDDTGSIGHVLLAGFEFGDQGTLSQRINGFFDSTPDATRDNRQIRVVVGDAIFIPPIAFRDGVGSRLNRSDADILAVYAQDQVSLGDHFDVIAGIRYDRFTLDVDNLLAGESARRRDNLWSPRAGLVFKPVEPVSVYASYSRSYLPQSGDQFTSLDATAAALEPERFDNYEIGVKWDVRPDLAVSAAAYRLDRSNTRAPNPANPGQAVLTGEQRSEGIEFGLAGSIGPRWQLSASYALQDAEIRSRTTACDPAARDCDVPQVPRHQASLWTRYDFTPRLGAGVGLYHQSKSFASISNEVVLPAYTRVDAAAFFQIADGIEAQLNVENLLGEDYFPTAHNDNNITPGAPTTARATVRVEF